MKKRDRILLDIQEESSVGNQDKLETSTAELETVDGRIAELKTQVRSMLILTRFEINSSKKQICHLKIPFATC